MKSWYVLHTHPHAEDQVGRVLDAKGLSVYLPRLKTRRIKRNGEAQWGTEPFFRGYLFSRLDVDTEDWLIARSTPGVSYILGQHTGGHRVPVPVPDALVDQLTARVDHENAVRWDRNFQSGDRVLILAGPFRHLEAVFDRRLSASGRGRVLVASIARLVPMEVALDNLQRLR